jgi:hypothetical protein
LRGEVVRKALIIILSLGSLSSAAWQYGQEIGGEEFRQRRAMIRPAGGVIFDFRPHESGFIVVVVNYGKTDFSFQPGEIAFRQGNNRWTPLYMTVAPDAADFLLQFSEDVMPNTIKKYGRDEKITIGGGNWQTFKDLQADLREGPDEGLWPFCFVAIEKPLPDYAKPLDIRVKGRGKSVILDERP